MISEGSCDSETVALPSQEKIYFNVLNVLKQKSLSKSNKCLFINIYYNFNYILCCKKL